MIAFVRSCRHTPAAQSQPAWHAGFMELLPDIHKYVRFAFRRLEPERRDEAVQEAIANALVAYVRLFELGKTDMAYASVLAGYAVKQLRDGRQVGCPLNSRDILSPYAQRKQGFTVTRLDQGSETDDSWKEILVEDPTCTPAELAASRLDFKAWLSRLPRQKRRIAATLAAGETTDGTARKFRVTSGRISQMRRELSAAWQQFQGC